LKNCAFYDIIRTFSGRHWSSFLLPAHAGVFYLTKGVFMNQTEKNNMENIDTNKAIDMEFEQAYNKLKEREGGYTDGKNQIKDEPTNMGIKQSTLDRYSAKHLDKNFPSDVKHLTATQAKEIYKYEYWNNTKIPEIKNDRIRDAVFDMNVMGGAGKTVQRTLNSFLDANLVVDGDIDNETIKSINAIVDSKVDEFIIALKTKRIDYLKGTKNWVTAKNGWTIRTNKY
jgi:lysozyme family protein